MSKYKYNRYARISEELQKELAKEQKQLKDYEKKNYTYGEILERRVMGKKASIYDAFLFMVFAFLIIVFFAVWVYAVNLMDTTLQLVPDTQAVNVSSAVDTTLSVVNSANQLWLPLLAYSLIFGMIISIFISNFLVKANPVFFIGYVVITIVAFITAVILSNTYETLSQDATLSAIFSSWTIGNFILLYLPHLVTVVGILGAVFLFSGIQRDAGLGGGVA